MNDAHRGLMRIEFLILGVTSAAQGSITIVEVLPPPLYVAQEIEDEFEPKCTDGSKAPHQVDTLYVLKPPSSIQSCFSCRVHCCRGERWNCLVN